VLRDIYLLIAKLVYITRMKASNSSGSAARSRDDGLPSAREVFLGVKRQCAWFLRCTNPATQIAVHPDLGERPTCERCVRIIRAARQLVEVSNGLIAPHATYVRAVGGGSSPADGEEVQRRIEFAGPEYEILGRNRWG